MILFNQHITRSAFAAKSTLLALSALLLSLGTSTVHAVVFIQNFEVNSVGVFGITSGDTEDADSVSPIVDRVTPTGGDTRYFLPDTPPSGGDYFMEVSFGYDNASGIFGSVQGDRAALNGGPQAGGFWSGSSVKVDVYFEDPTVGGGDVYGAGDGFYLETNLLDNTNSAVGDRGGFGVRLVDDGGLTWRIGADGAVKGFSGVTGATTDVLFGWYSMETVWIDDGAGNVDRIDTLYNSSGVSVLSETAQDVLAVTGAGHLGSAIIGNGDTDGLPQSLMAAVAIDNVTIVPEPQTYALLAGLLALTAAASRRRAVASKI